MTDTIESLRSQVAALVAEKDAEIQRLRHVGVALASDVTTDEAAALLTAVTASGTGCPAVYAVRTALTMFITARLKTKSGEGERS